MPRSTTNGRKAFRKLNRVEQVIGRVGETATFLKWCVVSLTLHVAVSPHINSVVRCFLVICKLPMLSITFQKFSVASLLILLVALSVAEAQEKNAGIMTYDEYAKVRHAYPYIVELQIGKGALLYFGAQHTNDPKHAQIARIEKLWKEFRPTLALNEGGDPPVLQSVSEAVSRIGESGLVRYLAVRDKVPVRSLEPSRADEAAFLLKTYTPEQVKVFYALRQVPQFRNSKRDETIETHLDFVLGKWLSSVPGLEGSPRNLSEFEQSCLWLSPKLKDWRDVEQSWFDPIKSEAYTNQVSRLSGEFRDRFMVKLLIDEVKKGERVFAVVGGSHVVMQERALKAISSDTP